MQIYVGKNGQQLGPFSLEEVNRKLADRTFVETDLAWYEGAAGWAPLSSVAGVVIPPAASAAPTVPAPGPGPVPAATPAPAPTAIPSRPSASIAPAPGTASAGYKTMARVGWILLGATLLLSCIPILGCGTWILVWPVALAAIILGIIVMSRGGTGQGIGLIVAAIVLVPLAFVVPVFSTALFGDKQERRNETQIMENLRTIDGAKGQWVTATKASNGAEVTMTSLTTYLSGKEIKPVVEERYDPMPVGQAPTATLPAKKTLGGFKEGEVLTAAAIEKDLANGSFSWIKTTTWSGTSPTPAVVPSIPPKVTTPPPPPSPAATPKPEVSPSPAPQRPSASPRPNVPHSLISPRQQQEEPGESPSARQSPSAKFAPPQKGPQMNPRQSPSEPDNSSGPRQGKKNPPREVPSPSPEDDDE